MDGWKDCILAFWEEGLFEGLYCILVPRRVLICFITQVFNRFFLKQISLDVLFISPWSSYIWFLCRDLDAESQSSFYTEQVQEKGASFLWMRCYHYKIFHIRSFSWSPNLAQQYLTRWAGPKNQFQIGLLWPYNWWFSPQWDPFTSGHL